MAINYTYGKDIAEDAFQRAGIEDTIVTDKMKRFVNRAYFDLLKMAEWPWALEHPPGIINTIEKVDCLLTATRWSATATINVDSATIDLSGRKIMAKLNQIPYRILTHSGTDVVLDATWKEIGDSPFDCSVFQDEYDLADSCLKPWSFRGRNCQTPFRFRGAITHHHQWDEETYGGAIIDVSLIQHKKVRFKPFLNEAVTVEYLYCRQHSPLTFTGAAPADVPVVPLWDRHVIADMALLLQLLDWVDHAPGYSTKISALNQQITAKIREMKSFYSVSEDFTA